MVDLLHVEHDGALAGEGGVDELEGVVAAVDLEVPYEALLCATINIRCLL